MRLIKLLAYSLLGFVLYELYLGMTEGCGSASSEASRGGRLKSSDQPVAAGHAGRKVAVEEANGAHRTRSVRRGVVH
jgi:hypothetical protein